MNPEIPAPPADLAMRRCFSCHRHINPDKCLSWDFLDFCNESCILRCNVTKWCMHCSKMVVEENHGKWLMQIAGKFYQFCDEECLKNYHSITKFCTCCEKVIIKRLSKRLFSVQLEVNGSETAEPFCSAECLDKFNFVLNGNRGAKQSRNVTCLVCDSSNAGIIVYFNSVAHYVCSLECRLKFTSIQVKKGAGECLMCRKYFSKERIMIFFNQNTMHRFCSNICRNIYKRLSKVHFNCNFCLNLSDSFSMIKRYCNVRGTHIFCSVNCMMLANTSECLPPTHVVNDEAHESATKKTLVIVSAPKVPEQRNVVTSCSIRQSTKGTNTDTVYADRSTQTNFPLELIPVPVPIYLPMPSHTYNIPQPVPMPFPLPIPTPIFIPITQKSLDLLKDTAKFTGSVTTDPLQMEMLQIADVLIEQNQIDNTKETSEVAIWQAGVDFERELPDNVTQIRKDHYAPPGGERRGKKRHELLSYTSESKRRSYTHYNSGNEVNVLPVTDIHLDYNLGINAWKQWVTTVNYNNKNLNLQIDILQMCPEELNYALCLFIRDLRKPNGELYAPDTIYYLCLGIQYYLNCNGRMENVFYDGIFEMFTACLDELAKKFCSAYHDDSQFIVTRVEEEHLWETKQLGCYSPYVLLNTIIYFNTKYYHRSTVKEHMDLSFFHMQRFYKKSNKNENMNLRYYNNQEDYEIDNESQLRCPTNLYEYYVSKCPENIKHSLELFYLVPEKHSSCDSPLWYTTQSLSEETLSMILNRIKMVKEINIALING